YIIGDLIALNLAFLITYYIRFNTFEGILDAPYWYLELIFNALWGAIAIFAKTYQISRLEDYLTIAKKNLRAIAWHFALVAVLLVLLQEYRYSRFHLLISYLLFAILILLWRLLITWALGFYRRLGYNQMRIVIVGYGKAGLDLYNFVNKNK
ncbi:MAG: hypothetical protein ACK40K_09305, partial [Raineya sp.]